MYESDSQPTAKSNATIATQENIGQFGLIFLLVIQDIGDNIISSQFDVETEELRIAKAFVWTRNGDIKRIGIQSIRLQCDVPQVN